MAKSSKSTKKFVKKHLGAALKSRKKFAARGGVHKHRATKLGPHAEQTESAEAVEKLPRKGGKVNSKETKASSDDLSKHREELDSLKEKDPAFYEFLKEHDQSLLDFADSASEKEEDDEDEVDLGLDDSGDEGPSKSEGSPIVLSTSMVEEWCVSIREKQNIGALRNFLQAFRTASHYGDGEGAQVPTKYTISSTHVFNKVMMFGLCEMDGTFRRILGLPIPGEKPAKNSGFSAAELLKNTKWKKLVEPFVKAYLGNSLNILKQMIDTELTAFVLRRLKASVPFIGQFPNLARKFLKVALHYFSSGDGVVPLVSLLFVREMAMLLGEETLRDVLKGVYKVYAANARFVNSTTLPQIRFRANCVVELYGIDLSTSYQMVFVFIQQMAVLLRNALTMKTKTAFKSVYCWQYINCLHVWVQVISKYHGEAELLRLSYPLVQVLQGVSQLIPTVRYFPLRLHCAKMMNELAAVTGTYIPVSALLFDMLEFKELSKAPTGGLGKTTDMDLSLKIPKPTLRTQKLQEDCIAAVMEELARHLEQWSYAIAFPELAVIPLVQLRQMLKRTKVDRLSRKVKQLVAYIERNVAFVGRHRDSLSLSLDDSASVAAFLQAEKKSGSSPLSQYVAILRQGADQFRTRVYGSADATVEKDDRISARDTDELTLDGGEDDIVEDLFQLPGDEGRASSDYEEDAGLNNTQVRGKKASSSRKKKKKATRRK